MFNCLLHCNSNRVAVLAVFISNCNTAAATLDDFGTPLRPFAATSPWNSRPLEPVFDNFVIPESKYFPAVGSGAYSTGVFIGTENDPTVEVWGPKGKPGVADPNTGKARSLTIEHWPAGVAAAKGSDGHADIIDPVAGLIHSFWQLRQQDGRWTAALYAWSRLDGRGWGDTTHFYQGARATGVPTSAGIIRSHEVNDGFPVYRHALAMSLTYNALARDPAYIFPATSADNNASTTNSGEIPEGALLMLPSSFDTARIANPALRKIADTLQMYGAYVVDRNDGTPFYIYAENGSSLNVHGKGWNNAVAAELQRIRAGLRQVVSAKSWVDGNGEAFTPTPHLNLLTMQGRWRGADDAGRYNPQLDALVFPPSEQALRMVSLGELNLTLVRWAAPRPNEQCKMTVHATGGGKLRLQLRNMDYTKVLLDSGELGNGATRQFACPNERVRTEMHAISGAGQASTVRAELYTEPTGAK